MIFLAAPILALWRVCDGGWPYRPPLSNLIGYGLAVGFSWLAMGHWVGLLVGLLYGRGLTQGYEDWNSFEAMVYRSWFAIAVGLALVTALMFGVYDPKIYSLGAMLFPIVGNIIQPWLRKQFDGHASNRVAEGFEGLCVGLAISSL